MTEDDTRRFMRVFEALVASNESKATEELFIEAVRLLRLEGLVYTDGPSRRMNGAYQ
jgi:hypothetical protein